MPAEPGHTGDAVEALALVVEVVLVAVALLVVDVVVALLVIVVVVALLAVDVLAAVVPEDAINLAPLRPLAVVAAPRVFLR